MAEPIISDLAHKTRFSVLNKKANRPNQEDSATMDRHAERYTSRCVGPPFLPAGCGAVVRSSGEFPYNSIGSLQVP